MDVRRKIRLDPLGSGSSASLRGGCCHSWVDSANGSYRIQIMPWASESFFGVRLTMEDGSGSAQEDTAGS